MDKVVAVLWESEPRDRAERRRLLLEERAPALLDAGAVRLGMCIADEHADVPSPSPFPLFGRRAVALVNLWHGDAAPQALIALLQPGFDVAAWPAEESVPTDYGDNAHAGARDWPDGTRSPGITVVSLLERPRRLDREEWIRRWHGKMSPVSAEIQPRTRYVRNLLGDPLTPGAPPFEGLVEEAWPSPRHVSNPWLFYGADSAWQLARNTARILGAVNHCFTLWRIPTAMMSEYLIRS